ncbi:MFS transporter [Hydrogenophaga crassostreae]|uniref:MFS transporter n=1 Tax=Hydrogenophaga crassostreae TaxID=1763535 RepID=A0A167I966_9BURK|nr:MFS transporter [Hydrogenophaga crassostreae]AOW15295.1 MFS transporter [Hydrogenophaga crassostreae]OAD42362.1 MFS transporter [Hydrogenophaga crassostreae]
MAATEQLGPRAAVTVFLTFAFAYFFSTLVRAITATLSPTLSAELSLSASELGLLAGGYFFGFALTQLPLGRWLDRYGPRRISVAFLSVAVLGCVAFALATSFTGLLAARVLTGMGVSACLMAPLTGYRRWLTPAALLRANSWMLMTGSLGMVAATLPVQWLMPLLGWRGLFWVLAALLVVCMGLLAWRVPAWRHPDPAAAGAAFPVGYRQILVHPYFRQMVPIAFINYGGLAAVQTLWAGPWMVRVTGLSAQASAQGLFAINLCMLCAFWTWGLINPGLVRRGLAPERLIAWGLPISMLVLAGIVWMGPAAGWTMWALFCVSGTFVSLCQPAVAQALPAQAAGRALSAFNLVIFAGIFTVQWGLGLAVDALGALGWDTVASFRGAFAVFGLCCLLAYGVFLRGYVSQLQRRRG